MPETRVRTPSGEIVTVRHPEGATERQIFAFAKRQMGRAPAKAATAKPEEPKSFAEETIGNIPESASRYFGGLAEAVMNPIETAKTIGQLGAGALSLGLGDDFQQRLGISDESEQLATRVGELMVERYGSLDAAKETLKNDPVGVLGDLSTVLGVGGVGIAKDVYIGDDLILASDSSVMNFGASKEISITHSSGTGLTFKNGMTGGSKPFELTIQSSESEITSGDKIGLIRFFNKLGINNLNIDNLFLTLRTLQR